MKIKTWNPLHIYDGFGNSVGQLPTSFRRTRHAHTSNPLSAYEGIIRSERVCRDTNMSTINLLYIYLGDQKPSRALTTGANQHLAASCVVRL